MSYFIANYKGGKNESFMYGGENKNKQTMVWLWPYSSLHHEKGRFNITLLFLRFLNRH
jgi:hypothetical protein